MINKKRGVSNIIGYILLVAIVIALSVLVYGWLKTYVPSESIECADGSTIAVDSYTYDCDAGTLNLTLKNNGRFDLAGYYIYGRVTEAEGLATTDLSPYTNLSSDGVIIFDGAENVISPNAKINSFFTFNTTEFTTIYSTDIVPVRYQKVSGRNTLINCGNAKVSEELKCATNVTAVCGNDIQETGEACDGTDLNSQTCVTQGFDSGTLSCNANCQSFVTSQCTINTCGDGVIDSGELCDDSNVAGSDGCSSSCQVEFGYTCSGTPSVCTGLGVFNATYSSVCKNCGSKPQGVPGNANWWYYNITLQELGNITGITVDSRQKCYDPPTVSDFCDPVKTDISSYCTTNHINNGSQVSCNNHYVWTTDPYLFTTETFNGTDDNSHFVTVSHLFNSS